MAQDVVPPERAVTLADSDLSEMSKNERLKVESKGLFHVADGRRSHSFRDEVDALSRGETPTISGTAKELSKFFGIYKQQGRGERGKKTQDYFLMVRIKNPAGGRLSAAQWRALDAAADFGDGTLRVTTRQGIQYHHVYGPKLAPLVRFLNREYRPEATLGACGDVNRNVCASPIDALDPAHDCRALELAHAIADELAPRTTSYFQVFLADADGATAGQLNPTEPLYGEQYLPRKFKIGVAHPADNSVDALTNDVAFAPVVTNGRADGSLWELYSGGGMGMTHNNEKTAPLLALHLGRIAREHVVPACRAIATLQKEQGERRDRRLARWKYTIRRLGVARVKEALRERFGIPLQESDAAPLPPVELHLGWHAQRGGGGWYGVSVENGRIGGGLRAALREAVDQLGLAVVLTPQQDVLLCDVSDRDALEAILDRHGVARPESVSRVRQLAMACPAKPTCGLAMTEAERVLPDWIDALEEAGLGDTDVMVRMTGCPNGCARPPTAEIGIYGYGKNDHVILVGGARNGSRLAHVLFPRIPAEQMVPVLVGLCRAIRERNPEALPAGEFLHGTPPEQLRAWIGLEGLE